MTGDDTVFAVVLILAMMVMHVEWTADAIKGEQDKVVEDKVTEVIKSGRQSHRSNQVVKTKSQK